MGMIRYGVHKPFEDAADQLIRDSLHGVTSMSAKSDILTPWKEQDRRGREVYSNSGVPDSATRRGMYNRAWNSQHEHLNSRDGVAPATRRGASSLMRFVADHGSSDLGESHFDD